MLFTKYYYIFIFLPLVFLLYFYINTRSSKLSKGFLVLASLYFYSFWNIKYLTLILLSIGFNYLVGIYLKKDEVNLSKRSLMLSAVTANILLLGYFKYANFFVANVNNIFAKSYTLPNIILPLAISFFTFQQIAYLVDCYVGKIKEKNFLDYVLFIVFFPQLIAGPIVHYKEMMPQFNHHKNHERNYDNILKGLVIFSLGLFKKIAIADLFAEYANVGFNNVADISCFESWLTSLSYTLQLYFDFSGYSDMAIGSALLFNIHLPVNFSSPYKALNIQDFWRRWHITLGNFLREYIYIPLGGNRAGKIQTYLNLIITFAIGGLWHGAAWTFVIWGLMHGVALAIHRLWSSFGFKLNKIISWFITFNFVNLSWVFFRAKNIDDAFSMVKKMIDLKEFKLPLKLIDYVSMWVDYPLDRYIPYTLSSTKVDVISFFLIVMFGFVAIKFKNTNYYIFNKVSTKVTLLAVLAFTYAVTKNLTTSSEVFLYFNF